MDFVNTISLPYDRLRQLEEFIKQSLCKLD